MTTTHPTGRMLKRAFTSPIVSDYLSGMNKLFAKDEFGNFIYPIIIRRSLNTTGVQFRVRQLQWDCIRLRKELDELYTPDEQNAHLAKPVTKKDILLGYLHAARYNNNFKPRVWNG